MAYDLTHRSAAQDAVLDGIVGAVTPGAVAIFDLDGCLFDNRPRQVQMLRAWAAQQGESRLATLKVEHFQDWSLSGTFERMGLDPGPAEELAERAFPFWKRWFFDDAYVDNDHAMPGAAAFVRRVAEAGARVMYLTGRNDTQRPATLRQLRRNGFPLDSAAALRTSELDGTDVAHKIAVFEELLASESVCAMLDNEPTHIVEARKRFPEAQIVWVQTDHSPRAVQVPPAVARIRGFLRTVDPVAGDDA